MKKQSKKREEKLSIACVHLLKGEKLALIRQDKPLDKRDTGRVFMCQECANRFEDIVKNKEIDQFITIHENCLKDKIEKFNL